MEIRNKQGQLIYTEEGSHNFEDLALREAVLEGMTLQGAYLADANIEGQTFEARISTGAFSSGPI